MSHDLDKGAHSVYSLYYHFIQVVKYRRKVFINDELVDFLKTKVREIADRFNVEVVSMECDKDHFHMLFKGTPVLKITEFVNAVKTITSREIQRKFPGVRKVLWKGKMWSPSYFLATSGQVTLPVLMKYVESQEDKRIEGV
ncbi:MAG: IS200/IS605 family transposase [Candidatus Thermoplasmatota archaeon]|nr:IS200/IS605 family transposase [Candidatus Thermoplasmatota archaeon]